MTVAKQFTRKTRPVPANMTSRHFYLIADTIHAAVDDAHSPMQTDTHECIVALTDLAELFADKLAQSEPAYDRNGNRRFDRERFLIACGVKGV